MTAPGPPVLKPGLLFFFLFFLLRAMLRKQWLAAAAYVLLLTVPLALGADISWAGAAAGILIYGLVVLVVCRFGLLALTSAFCVSGLLGPPFAMHADAWYFGNIAFLFGTAIAVAFWAYYTSVGGEKLWARQVSGGN